MKSLCIRFVPFIGIVLAGLAYSCGQSETERLKEALVESQDEVQSLHAENRRLSEQSSDLQSAYLDLKTNFENLEIDHDELVQWSRVLVQHFGPSVWHPGTYEKPVPYKQLPDATPHLLARELNLWFKASRMPRFILIQVRNRTAYVRIEDAAALTQEMGTTGASGYLNAIAFTLCSLKSIDCVDFDFPPGPHASPGPYCPESPSLNE